METQDHRNKLPELIKKDAVFKSDYTKRPWRLPYLTETKALHLNWLKEDALTI